MPGFDHEYYLLWNPDVATLGLDPLKHFLEHGWREGRDPCRHFSIREYQAASPDLGEDVNPLLHFLEFGWREGRDPCRHFSIRGYQAANPDLGDNVNPLVHFLEFGLAEGRQGWRR